MRGNKLINQITFMLDAIYYYNTVRQYLIAILIVFLFILLAKLIHYFVEYFLAGFFKKTKNRLDNKILELVYLPLVFFIVILGFYIGLSYLSFPENVNHYVLNTLKALFILDAIYFIFKFLDIVTVIFLRPIVKRTKSKLDDQIVPLLERFIKLIIAVLAIFVALENLGVDMKSLLTGLGIGGIAMALAAKDTLANIFGSISVVTDQPFYIGDIIRFKDYEGVVTDLGIRSTRIRTFDTTEITIPNSEFSASTIENISKRKAVKKTMSFLLHPSNNHKKIEKAKKIIEGILKKESGILKEYYVALIGFDLFGYQIKVVYWVKYTGSYKPYLETRHKIHYEIVKRFEKEKIPLGFRGIKK